MEIFSAKNINKSFKSSIVLNNITMTINRGDIYGFIGPNGAGKTTLIKIICGLTIPSAGSFTLFGKTEEKEVNQERKKMGIIVEQPALIQGFTCYQNLKFQALLLNIPNIEQKIDSLLQLVELTFAKDKKSKNLSLGMKQRLAIAIALLNDPEFLVLDEPINGLDPNGIVEIRELLLKLNKDKNITILISSHFLGELAFLINKVAIINHGKLLEERPFDELLKICQNKVSFTTSDNLKVKSLLDEKNIKSIIEDKFVCALNYNEPTIKLITMILANGIEIFDFKESKETLEQYFLNKIKEDNYATGAQSRIL